ncbi:MAG: histidinol-phosphate transaminase [Ottowia sp.]|nr:histidinol-phosphate transaminase [Ottowia sp.]
MNELCAAVFRSDVLSMAAYSVPNADGLVKLDAMENPFPLPTALQQALGQHLAGVALHRYPVPSYAGLRARLRQTMGVPEAADILLGNGSDELISMLALACAKPGACMLAPWPSFSMYEISAKLAGMRFVGVPLTAQFALDMPAMLAALAQHKPAVVYLAYPNNPTGGLFDDSQIEALLLAAPHSLFVVDEAYQPFAQVSWLARLGQFPNLLVLRTLSKLGLAGVRLGYLCGLPTILAQLEKVRPPYNVNVLTEAAVDYLLQHQDMWDAQAELLRQERTRVSQSLANIKGVTVFPSRANFVLVRVAHAQKTFDDLLAQGILIKNVSTMHPLLNQCLRITVGSPAQNDRLIFAFSQSI